MINLQPAQLFAQESYTYLEDIGKAGTVQTNNYDYFTTVYGSALTLIVALAVIMVVIGGVQYISTFASPGAKEEAKTRIWGALGGLLLALMSVLILRTINPELLKPNIFITTTP